MRANQKQMVPKGEKEYRNDQQISLTVGICLKTEHLG